MNRSSVSERNVSTFSDVRAVTARNEVRQPPVARCMSIRWALAWILIATAGCTLPHGAAVRASREFRCPIERIRVVERRDISPGLADVQACGHVARYNCGRLYRRADNCVREPIDSADADALMSLGPAPSPEASHRPPRWRPDGRRVCRDRADFDETRSCVLESNR